MLSSGTTRKWPKLSVKRKLVPTVLGNCLLAPVDCVFLSMQDLYDEERITDKVRQILAIVGRATARARTVEEAAVLNDLYHEVSAYIQFHFNEEKEHG